VSVAQCIPISLRTITVFVQAPMAYCPTLRSCRQADGHSHEPRHTPEPRHKDGFMFGGEALTPPPPEGLSRCVTESVAGVDFSVLQLRREELRLVQEETGVQILEVAGLYGCTVLVTGDEAAVQMAWPQVVKLLVPIGSYDYDQSMNVATPAEALPTLPAGRQAIQSFCPPPGLSMPTDAIHCQTSVQAHVQPEEEGTPPVPAQTSSDILMVSNVNEMDHDCAANQDTRNNPPSLKPYTSCPETGTQQLTPRSSSPSDEGISEFHKLDGKTDDSLPPEALIESEQSPMKSGPAAASKRKRRQEKKRAQKEAAAAEEAEMQAAAIESLSPVKFLLPTPRPLEGVKSRKKPIQILSNVTYSNGDSLGKSPTKFATYNFFLSLASRALVIGAKGAGKTAFARLLANLVPPTTGTVRRVEGLRVAYLSQQSFAELDLHKERCAERCCAWLSTLAWLQVSEPKIDDFETKSKCPPSGPNGASWDDHLRDFGLDLKSLGCKKVSSLSSAAKASLLLAASFWPRPHIVVLDDPGNWLDSMTTQALLEALATFKGGVVVMSHSKHQHRFEALATEKWMLRGGQLCCADSMLDKAAPVPSQAERTMMEQELKDLASLIRQKDKMTEEQLNKTMQRLETLRSMLTG